MRVLLVMPTPFESGRLGLENVVWLSEPVALTTVGAALQPEHEVRILDCRLEPEDALARELVSFRPDVVGTTSMTTDAYQAKAVLRMARKILGDVLTVVGGHHPTLSPHEFDEPYIDIIVQGEGEHTIREVVEHWSGSRTRAFMDIPGIRWLDPSGDRHDGPKRAQTTALDALPPADRSLIRRYQGRYFYLIFRPMASIFTSRGCSYDCNFCAIWEFYERRVRYLSATAIADQMEEAPEPFVFVLDDNFLVNKRRLNALCDELERRGIQKYWMTQGRTDFVADNPELVARLAKNGLVMLLSGYESNDEDTLAALRKRSAWEKNQKANRIMAELGIFSTGIFMVRPDFTVRQFDQLYETINSLDVGLPLVTILTPLPGTQLYRATQDQLLTTDHRMFDLLHPVLPTRLSREDFYREFSRSVDAVKPSIRRAIAAFAKARPRLAAKVVPEVLRFYARTLRYQRLHRDPATFLRDEAGLLNGPGVGLSWQDVRYPTAEAPQPTKTGAEPPLWSARLDRVAK
jgi:hopanoid C-3 methylase